MPGRQVSQSALGSEAGILFRSYRHRLDYVGGRNYFAPLYLLHQPEELTRRIRLAQLACPRS